MVGAGPAGLAAAGALRQAGVGALILERSAVVASSWRGHYDRLHLHTARRLSGLPGMAIPRRFGRWVRRDDWVAYLEEYSRRFQLEVGTGAEVERLEPDGEGWVLQGRPRPVRARSVVVATGYNNAPVAPGWPGQDRFPGRLLLSVDYRNPEPFRGRSVLVAGSGNSGAEIAADLAEAGAAQVWLSIRTPPNLQRREILPGVPTQLLGMLVPVLPVPFVDRLTLALHRLLFGGYAAYGLPVPDEGVATRVAKERIPLIDVGVLAQIRAGRVEVVPGVEGFDGADVLLAGGSRVRPDAVVAALGFRRNLEPLVGHLGVLDERGRPRAQGGEAAAPNLYFLGFRNSTRGLIFEISRDARSIARTIRAGRSV